MKAIPVVSSAIEKTPAQLSLDASRWSFINGWKVAAQADDRKLASGIVAAATGSAPELRSFARRAHQRSFKVWSQERNE